MIWRICILLLSFLDVLLKKSRKSYTLFVRRNGKTIWSGNSQWGDNGFGYISYDYFDKYSLDNWFPVDKNVKELF